MPASTVRGPRRGDCRTYDAAFPGSQRHTPQSPGSYYRPRRRLARNTAIFAFFTALSRVVGLVREIVAAYFFGTGLPASAFTIASQIPNLMSNLFAQAALSAAFVPVFTDLLQQGPQARGVPAGLDPVLDDPARAWGRSRSSGSCWPE